MWGCEAEVRQHHPLSSEGRARFSANRRGSHDASGAPRDANGRIAEHISTEHDVKRKR